MRKIFFSSLLTGITLCLIFSPDRLLAEEKIPETASVNGKYRNLLQTVNCPKDKDIYGEFADHGYYGGGTWCDQNGKAGYWVWVAPNWYVWEKQIPPKASANGKYANLLQVLNCPNDKDTYGEFIDYGHYSGGTWCDTTGKAGFWVWVAPNWYIWETQIPSQASVNGKYATLLQVLTCPKNKESYGKFKDYGYYKGGTWCKQAGKAGYWVWVAPNWYVWGELLFKRP